MSEGNWLRRLRQRTIERNRRAAIQVGVYRSATHLIAARLRVDSDQAPSVEQLEAVVVGTERDENAARRLAQTGIFQSARVVLALASEQYSTHPLPAPAVPDAELNDALRWQLREVLPYSPEDAVIACVRLARAEESGSPQSLLVVAAPRRTVAHAVAPLLAAGIEVHAVDIPEMAQRNLLARLPGSESSQALLGLDDASGLLTVLKNGELCFARRIQMPRSNALEEEDPEHIAGRVATQIQRSIEVVERQSGLAPIRTVWIGPHPYAALIARCTAEQTGFDCPQLDLQSEVRFSKAVPDLTVEASAGALVAIGAGLRSEEAEPSAGAGATAAGTSWMARLKAAA